jgi:hypothetical protein
MEVSGANAVDAWKQAAKLILNGSGELHNLSVTVDAPLALPHDAVSKFSPRSVVLTADDVLEVANTIFPSSLSRRAASRDELYLRYLSIMDRMRSRRGGFRTWGTYFERLVCFGSAKVNQLDRVIVKLNAWPIASKTGLVFHTSSPETDAPRTRGGPCWHYGELLCHKNGVIDLYAVYRNQDYFNKALGNFVGLGDLLNFICQQSGREPGKLICNAAHAFNGGRKADLSTLISQ